MIAHDQPTNNDQDTLESCLAFVEHALEHKLLQRSKGNRFEFGGDGRHCASWEAVEGDGEDKDQEALRRASAQSVREPRLILKGQKSSQ